MTIIYRLIQNTEKDNREIAELISTILVNEFGSKRDDPKSLINGDDFNSIGSLYCTMFGTRWPTRSMCLVAIDTATNTIIGSCGFSYKDNGLYRMAELQKLYVAKEWRNKGIGKHLFNTVMNEIANSGYTQVYLETSNKMETAIEFYKCAGFKKIQINDADKNYHYANTAMVYNIGPGKSLADDSASCSSGPAMHKS